MMSWIEVYADAGYAFNAIDSAWFDGVRSRYEGASGPEGNYLSDVK